MQNKEYMKAISRFIVLKWCVIMLLAVPMAACSDTADEPDSEESEEDVIQLTPQQLAYSNLVGNFYKSYKPSKGVILDESKPSERSEACESYEDAINDFERYLPSNDGDERFIKYTDNGIDISLDSLGNIKFTSESGDGVVARIDISLKDMPKYTVLYRHESSFGDNYSSDQNLYRFFSIGDLVEFRCPVWSRQNPVVGLDEDWKIKDGWRWGTCNSRARGVVVEVSAHRMFVFTGHRHQYWLKDHWKQICFDYNVISLEGWKTIYNSWNDNKSLFNVTYENNTGDDAIVALKAIMDGWIEKKHVCVDGDDIGLTTHFYLFYNPWYSDAKRINISDLRRGNFKVETVDYAYRKEIKGVDCNYYNLIEINRDWAEKVVKIYPRY